ncbi:sensor histidine kinase [Sorangium sp. So ce131]|uniref:sensor histidine kinase n=1 Tax=Sorangium sp. So ce131 TaxID=3133282 RepID=UPI003F60AB38
MRALRLLRALRGRTAGALLQEGAHAVERRSSLRGRAYALVVAVVLAPVAVIFGARQLDEIEAEQMLASARRAAEAAGAAMAAPASASAEGGTAAASAKGGTAAASAKGGGTAARLAAIQEAAAREGARVRVLDGRGRVIADRDGEPATSLRDRAGDLFFGPEGAPTLRDHDAASAPLPERAEIQRALERGRDEGCASALGGKLLVCHAALRIDAEDGPVVALAQRGSPRAIRALYDVRYPLLKLSLYALLSGLALCALLVRRIVRPIEALRDEVLSRAEAPLSGEGILSRAPRAPREIGELADAFNALFAAIAEQSRSNHAFMVDLVHELKSPVAAVRAAADTMRGGGDLPAARAERLGRALYDSSQRLDAVVSQFLELARAEAGLPDEERAVIDAGELVSGLARALCEDPRHATLRVDTEVAEAHVRCVPGRLESAIQNVLENAASFAGEGGAVRARVRARGGACEIEVTDTGPGIPAEDLPRVFDRFFTRRRGGQGTGLGLALARAIVEAHGGTLEAASPPGEGARFTIRLPLVSHGVHTKPAEDSPGA